MQQEKREILLLGVSVSPRKSATEQALDIALASGGTVPGTKTAKISLAGKKMSCCINCNRCIREDSGRCMVFEDDFSDEYLELFKRCDGILLSAPVYYMNTAGPLNVFLIRMRPLSKYARAGCFGSRMDACIAVAGMRNGGQDLSLCAMNSMLQAYGTNVIGGEVYFYNGASVWSRNQTRLSDEDGEGQARTLGKKLAYMCHMSRRA